ncbi:DedA family protein [Salipiger mangrovisoli]|uniref:VTT domain-containing protein n=1 Tax=Salipiger mangrovisoli TaxID=2865933 RepID=A0ABR9WX70_9RHOB|nr:VTT domain-containing protein [Salipiger mangrovisoli]MBE9635881.1 VTT domain-containing protein [Salipiger mangrovisoli]
MTEVSGSFSDTVLALLPELGLPILGATITFASLGVPMLPASLMLLVAGTLAAAGELPVVATMLTALCAAVLGDQLGFWLGRLLGPKVAQRDDPTTRRALALLAARGPMAVFLSRWLIAPLGPAMNVVAGAGGLGWPRFLLADLAGEIVWASSYMALGASFAPFIPQIAELSSDITTLLAALTVALAAGVLLRRHRPHGPR